MSDLHLSEAFKKSLKDKFEQEINRIFALNENNTELINIVKNIFLQKYLNQLDFGYILTTTFNYGTKS